MSALELLHTLSRACPVGCRVSLSTDIDPERVIVTWESRHLPGGHLTTRIPAPPPVWQETWEEWVIEAGTIFMDQTMERARRGP